MKKSKRLKTTDFSDDSEIVIEGLDLYDVQRQPRPVCTDEDLTVSLPLGQFTKELQCPICLQLLSKTLTVMECLHRFCSECVNSSLRLGKKECPVCRVGCATRRSLRPDLKFDELIHSMYGDLEVHEENVAKMIYETTVKSCEALKKSFHEGLQRQEDIIQADKAKRKKSNAPFPSKQPPQISFLLKPKEDYFGGQGRPTWVSVNGNATISHVSFLVIELFFKKYTPDSIPSKVQIIGQSGEEIADDISLLSLRIAASKQNEDLVLTFQKKNSE